MDNFFDYLKVNANWLKDLFTIIFTFTGTVIAILTYRRAKATILQPIRTEVIKKQTEIMSELLTFMKSNANIDYPGLIKVNVYFLLRDYNLPFENEAIMLHKCNVEANLKGSIIKKDRYINTRKMEVFPDNNNNSEVSILHEFKSHQLRNGVVDLESIYVTKTHFNTISKFRDFKNNPFMPASIQTILDELVSAINSNVRQKLKKHVEAFLIDYYKLYSKDLKPHPFDINAVILEFEISMTSHKGTLSKLNNEIRKYLRIDDKW